jgi:hypothetical protein
MIIIDRRPVVTVGQMPFAAGYINQRANLRRHRIWKRKQTLRKLAAKLGMRSTPAD